MHALPVTRSRLASSSPPFCVRREKRNCVFNKKPCLIAPLSPLTTAPPDPHDREPSQHRTELPLASCKTGCFLFVGERSLLLRWRLKIRVWAKTFLKATSSGLFLSSHKKASRKEHTKKRRRWTYQRLVCVTLRFAALQLQPRNRKHIAETELLACARCWCRRLLVALSLLSDAWLAANRVSFLSVRRNRFPKHFEDHQKTEMRSSKHKPKIAAPASKRFLADLCVLWQTNEMRFSSFTRRKHTRVAMSQQTKQKTTQDQLRSGWFCQ